MDDLIGRYKEKLFRALDSRDVSRLIHKLATDMAATSASGRTIFICGNGGSAGNAIHLANDFLYGAGKTNGRGLNVEALPANGAVMTCLGNDIGYDKIFSEQIRVKGKANDLLIVLSGSGNSPNVVNALKEANSVGIKTWAILGFDGGLCKTKADNAIHFKVDDMQVSEDLQLIVGHLCMQWLSEICFEAFEGI